MATHLDTTPPGVPATVRLPHAFTPEQEREHLLRIVRPTMHRIGELNRLIERPAALPQSGLHLVGTVDGGLLFKGGDVA